MARCHGEHCPYGHGHHDEHVRAALLGWARRGRGREFEGSEQKRWLSLFAGGDVSHAHAHRDAKGRNIVMFKHKGKWFEVSKSAWRGMVSAGREMERDESREQRRAEAERKRLDREHASAARKAEAQRKAQAKYEEAQERAFRRVQNQERADVVKELRRIGGVKATKYDHGEWLTLPGSIRNQKHGKTLDTAREHIEEHFPWLHLETERDFLDYFDRVDTHRRNAAARRREAA